MNDDLTYDKSFQDISENMGSSILELDYSPMKVKSRPLKKRV